MNCLSDVMCADNKMSNGFKLLRSLVTDARASCGHAAFVAPRSRIAVNVDVLKKISPAIDIAEEGIIAAIDRSRGTKLAKLMGEWEIMIKVEGG